ncbi:FAD-dependent oxidoreductase, partial [bacterium]|nr:FAD-dependent oxidoreductase [bacterium]
LNLLDRPAERGAIVIKTGLMIYDSFTRKQKTEPRHQFHNRSESLAKYPMLNPQIKFTATYFDGEILSPERYCIDLIHDAMAEGDHAKALNYAQVEGISGETVNIKDALTGELLSIVPKVIVNAAGPWIDRVNSNFGLQEHYIGGTKGSHLVLDVPELRKAIGDHEFFFENKDGRIVLILPFYDKVVVGTTDIQVEDIDDVVCTAEEEDYFLDLIARIYPAIKISRQDIVFRFSGVRPLEYVKAKTTGQITRDHSIKRDNALGIPVLSLVGGKWTSYRAFSEQAANEILSYLGILRVMGTAQLKVNGGEKYPRTEHEKRVFTELLAKETGISTEYANALFLRYGTYAKTAADEINAISIAPLKSIENWTHGEVRWLIRNEDVFHLEDLFLRRTTIAWLGNLTGEVLLEFAAIHADELGLSGSEKQAEILRTVALMDDRHGVKIVL